MNAASNAGWMNRLRVTRPSHCLGRPSHWWSITTIRSARLRHLRAAFMYAGMCHEFTIRTSGWNSSSSRISRSASGSPLQPTASRPSVSSASSNGARYGGWTSASWYISFTSWPCLTSACMPEVE